MTVLKELTWENHKRAEKTLFMKRLAKKELTPREYYTFLTNQFMMYKALEDAGEALDLFADISSIKRLSSIEKDLVELETQYGYDYSDLTDAAVDYMDHIETISKDRDKLLAHFYVRYMGDLSGGQILKKLVPGSGAYYDFDGEVDTLKERLSAKLNVDMSYEANLCFEMMTTFLEELEEKIKEYGHLG